MVVMLSMATLRNEGIPDELANRMSMAHGSRQLLCAIKGEPEPEPEPQWERPPAPKPRVKTRKPVPKDMPIIIPKAVRDVIQRVADVFEVTPAEMRGKGKWTRLVHARAVAIRLIRERRWETGDHKHSLPSIGLYFNRDHSTICHSLDHFDTYAKQFPEIAEIYEALRERGQ
jgi:hypothetical protein